MIRQLDAPLRPGRFDELLLLHREHLAAHDSGDVGPAREREHDDHRDLDVDRDPEELVADVPPQELRVSAHVAERGRGDEQRRHDEEQVGDAREHLVGGPAEVRRERADERAEDVEKNATARPIVSEIWPA